MICISVSKEVRHFSYFLVEYLSIGAAKGHNKSAICPGKGEGGVGGWGRRGLLNKGLYCKALPRGSTTLINSIFDRKCTPFVYPLLTNGAPFTYLV